MAPPLNQIFYNNLGIALLRNFFKSIIVYIFQYKKFRINFLYWKIYIMATKTVRRKSRCAGKPKSRCERMKNCKLTKKKVCRRKTNRK